VLDHNPATITIVNDGRRLGPKAQNVALGGKAEFNLDLGIPPATPFTWRCRRRTERFFDLPASVTITSGHDHDQRDHQGHRWHHGHRDRASAIFADIHLAGGRLRAGDPGDQARLDRHPRGGQYHRIRFVRPPLGAPHRSSSAPAIRSLIEVPSSILIRAGEKRPSHQGAEERIDPSLLTTLGRITEVNKPHISSMSSSRRRHPAITQLTPAKRIRRRRSDGRDHGRESE